MRVYLNTADYSYLPSVKKSVTSIFLIRIFNGKLSVSVLV